MIVSFSLIRRRDDISLEEFRSHWLDPHGPMTALIPGTRRYVQNHVNDGPGTNAVARSLRLDGFAELSFDTPANRISAHRSAELAACNEDSRLFIGAVSRVITDDDNAEPPAPGAGIKQILLTTQDAPASASLPALLQSLEHVALIRQLVLKQGGARNSAVPFHGIEVDTLHEIWVDGPEALARNAAILTREAPGLASFQLRTHVFI